MLISFARCKRYYPRIFANVSNNHNMVDLTKKHGRGQKKKKNRYENSPNAGLNDGSSYYKYDALPLSYWGGIIIAFVSAS